MDTSLDIQQQRRFDAWLHSPSVFGPDRDELVLAFKIAQQHSAVPSKVLKVLRGVVGQDPQLVATIEQFVALEPALGFVGEAPLRRVCLLEQES
jgi:hypothetical protein